MKHELYNNEEEVSEPNSGKVTPKISIEEAMEVVGQKHRYQIHVMAISFLVWFITTYGYMVIPYYLSVPEFECKIDGEWQICGESSGACDPNIKSRMLTEKSSTIASDFNLICDKRSTRVMIESLPLFAGVIGTFSFMYISDKLGRRTSIQLCWIMGIISSLLMNFSKSLLSLIISSFGVGFSALILQSLVVVHLNELSIGQYRVMGLIGTYVFWSLSEMQYIWMIALLPGWKWNMFAFYTLPLSILFIFSIRMIHDSPRYLFLKNRGKCLESLNRIAAFNDRQPVTDGQLEHYKGDQESDYGYIDLFIHKSMRTITINMSLVYLFVNFLYQGTQVVLNTVGSSFGESSLYVGIGELIGFGFSDILAHKIPRKIGIFISLAATSLICITFYLFPMPSACAIDATASCWQKPFQGFMISLARAISSVTFGLQVLMCGEIYPNTLKSLGFGFNMGVGYFGTFLAPYAVDIANSFNFQPIVFIGIIAFIGNFSCLFSQETLNKVAPMDIPEIEAIQLERETAAAIAKQNINNLGESDDEEPQKIGQMDPIKSLDSVQAKNSQEFALEEKQTSDNIHLIHSN